MSGQGVASPGGFSYAQAAKGRASNAASQAPSSKVTSGAATPATGMLSDIGGGNWADDVELSVGDKQPEAHEEAPESSRPVEVKSAVERAKSEEKAQNSSGVSSPDLAASATSNDDASSAQNGSSQTSWEAKSQASETPQSTEGSWIAARAARADMQQSSDKKKSDTPSKGKKGKGEKADKSEKTEAAPAPPKPVVLYEAPAPTVNPWAKRAEETKAKAPHAQPSPPKAAINAPTGPANNLKENQRPRADAKKKPQSEAAPATNDSKKASSIQGKVSICEGYTLHSTDLVTAPKVEATSTNYTKPTREERQSLPNVAKAPPPVKDEVSWPTPDTAPQQDKERKPTADAQTESKGDETADSGKPRKKQEWKPMAVVPNIIWETQSMRDKPPRSGYANGETRSRGSATNRGGRGGFRGSANGVSPRQPGDDGNARRGRADNVEETAKPQRASSTSSVTDRSQQQRSMRQQSLAEPDGGKPASQQSKDISAVPDFKPAQRDNKSPKESGIISVEHQADESVPEPIPRRNSQSTQAEQASIATQPSAREEDTSRAAPTENRKDGRNGENGKESGFNGSVRGSKRGGRGRGGSREFVNGHHNGHAFVNGTAPADFGGAAPFGVPQSPSFQTSRGNHQNAFSGSGRGGWRNNPRAQSIPMEGYYSRYPYPAPIQTFGPGMYDYGVPMSAMQYSPMMDPTYLFGVVSQQLEYYFSVDNLLKDTYLRRNMDSQGFVYLDVIAAFNRIKSITQDRELLKQVCLQSETVDIRIGEDGKERLRRNRDWEKFVMPIEDRFPAAKYEGPKQLERPEQRMPNFYGPMQLTPQGGIGYPMYPPRPNDRRSYDSAFAMMNGAARGAFFPENSFAEMNGEEMRGRATKSPINNRSSGPVQAVTLDSNSDSTAEPDVFPDQNIEQLTVCVKLSARRVPYHTAASRTFSDGSIDTRTIAREMEKSDAQTAPAANGDKLTNGVSTPTESRVASPSGQQSPERSATDVSVFWVRDNDQPMGNLPSDLVPEPYVQLRLKALEQRGQAATGNCPYDLEVLYQFWSHFLIRNFNNRMYREFKYYAEADAAERHSFSGKKTLLKYYGQALSSTYPIPTCVLNDYITTVKSEGPKADGAAFKQLRQAWRNGALNLRNRKKLTEAVDESLKVLLEG